MRKNNLLILLMMLFLTIAGNGILMAEILNENEVLSGLESPDVQKRISVLIRLNDAVGKDNKVLTEKLKQKIYFMLDDYVANSAKYQRADVDDEGLYNRELESIAAKINDQRVLPYLMSFINSSLAQKAIARQGERTLEGLFNRLAEEKIKGDAERSIIQIMTLMVQDKKEGYVAQGETRKKIKNKLIWFYKNHMQPLAAVSEKKKHDEEVARIANYVKKPMLEFFWALGDADVIPLVEDIANNDQHYEEFPKEYLKYRKMPPAEIRKNYDEIMRAKADHDNRAKASGVEEKMRFYPVRERAKEVLAELKKKNGIQ